MPTETALGAKLKAAGVDTASARLEAEAFRILRECGGKPERALERFIRDVLSEPALVDALALRFLREAAESMKGLPGEGPRACAVEGQHTFADARQQNGDGAGQIFDADRGQGHIARPSPADAGRILREVRMAKEPTPLQRRMNAELAKATALTVFDTQKVRGRGAWGDIAIGELSAIEIEGTRDAALAKLIRRDVPIGTSTTKKVREVISLANFQRAIQKAAEVVDVEVGHAA